MTRSRAILAAAVALALAAPVRAQPSGAQPGPDDDLRCASWAAAVLGTNKDDPEIAAAFGMALAWFVARFEGATGRPFEQAMTVEYLNGLAPELDAIEQACRPRMEAMGTRFTEWGAKLQAGGQ